MMRRVLSLTITLLAATVCYSALPKANHAVFADFTYNGVEKKGMSSWRNPILPGWYSDPSVCRTGDDYWLVTSTFGYFPGVPLFHSRDLVNWELVRHILDRPSQLPHLNGQSIDRGGIYAPDISYNPHNKTYYMITTDVGKGHFYVTAKDPRGEWSDPVWLPQIGGIDPSFFFDNDGKAYIVHKEDTEGKPKWSNNRAIRIIRFDTKTGQTYGEDVPFREEGVGPEEQLARDEGPHIYKINGKYYMICAEGGTSWAHSEVCYRADDIRGPYEKRVILESEFSSFSYLAQGTIVDTPDGDWYGIIFQDRGGVGRVLTVMPCRWIDGWPMLGDEEGRVPDKVRPVVSGQETTAIVKGDDYSTPTLGLHWQWNHNPVNDAWSLTERAGWLRLKTSRVVSSLYLAPNTLTQRMEGPQCSGSISMDISKMKDGDCAGLAAFNSDTGALVVRKRGKQTVLEMCEMTVRLTERDKQVTDVSERVVESIPLTGNMVWLRVDGDFCPAEHGGRDAANFFYSLDGETWTQIGTHDY
ncbi:MAG: glycoside hydrolase family 43 protein, partial [Prevotella sp.]|nr:glycoside hydrolase family 43 protein [Prevotella sp.]